MIDLKKYPRYKTDEIIEINSKPEIERCRKAILLYQGKDKAYAQFRLQAYRFYSDLIIRLVLRKKLTKELNNWLDTWMGEPEDSRIGNLVRDVYHSLERESGIKFKR